VPGQKGASNLLQKETQLFYFLRINVTYGNFVLIYGIIYSDIIYFYSYNNQFYGCRYQWILVPTSSSSLPHTTKL
jgi:hypothetical protein